MPYAAGPVASGRGSWVTPTYAVTTRTGDEGGSGEPPAHAPLDEELPQPQLERVLVLS